MAELPKLEGGFISRTPCRSIAADEEVADTLVCNREQTILRHDLLSYSFRGSDVAPYMYYDALAAEGLL